MFSVLNVHYLHNLHNLHKVHNIRSNVCNNKGAQYKGYSVDCITCRKSYTQKSSKAEAYSVHSALCIMNITIKCRPVRGHALCTYVVYEVFLVV